MTVAEIKLQLEKQKEQRIEFALIEDIKSSVGKAGGQFLSYQSDLFEIESKISSLKPQFLDALKLTEKAKQISKELGAESTFKIASEYETGIKENIKKLDAVVSKLKSI